MAKKKKSAKKKPAPKKAVRKARPKGPRAQALPGMEQIRNTRLDRFCESIGNSRDEMNRIRNEEKDDKRNALDEMRSKGIEHYRSAGVELERIPGEEKLRVRTSKEDVTTNLPEESDESESGDNDADTE